MLHGVPWFLLGSLWAVLFCEYRAFRARLKLSDRIQALESELHVIEEEHFESQKAYRNVRIALLDLLAGVREHRPREVEAFASGRATVDKEHRPREVEDFASGRATVDKEHRPREVED